MIIRGLLSRRIVLVALAIATNTNDRNVRSKIVLSYLRTSVRMLCLTKPACRLRWLGNSISPNPPSIGNLLEIKRCLD